MVTEIKENQISWELSFDELNKSEREKVAKFLGYENTKENEGVMRAWYQYYREKNL